MYFYSSKCPENWNLEREQVVWWLLKPRVALDEWIVTGKGTIASLRVMKTFYKRL